MFSSTVTLKLQVELFPARSIAVNSTEVVPTGKAPPESGPSVWVISIAPGQLSVAVASAKLTIASQSLGAALTVISPGQIISGGAASETVTENEHVAVFPSSS